MVDVVYKGKDGKVRQRIDFHDKEGKPYDEIRTKQEFLAESDINTIISRFQKNGVEPIPNIGGTFGDFSDVTNYQDAMIKIQEAHEYFDDLPAKTRAYFENDPEQLLLAIEDPSQENKLIELGILVKNDDLGGTTTPVSEKAGEAVDKGV